MKKKTPGDIIIDQIMYSSWDMVHSRWTDGWTDKWKKWHIEVGAPPNNYHRCYENTFIFHVKANQKKLISCKIKLLEWSLKGIIQKKLASGSQMLPLQYLSLVTRLGSKAQSDTYMRFEPGTFWSGADTMPSPRIFQWCCNSTCKNEYLNVSFQILIILSFVILKGNWSIIVIANFCIWIILPF